MKILKGFFSGFENSAAFIIILLIALFPAMEIIARKFFSTGIPDSAVYIQHLILLVTFIGGMITARGREHLAIKAGIEFMPPALRERVQEITGFLASLISWILALSSLSMVLIGFDPGMKVGIFPVRLIAMVMPVGYAVMAFRFVSHRKKTKKIMLAFSAFFAAFFLSFTQFVSIYSSFMIAPEFMSYLAGASDSAAAFIAVPAILIIIISSIFGSPIFIVLGGTAHFLFVNSMGALEVIPNEAYTMLISHSIPAIPLFTVTGFILSESRSGERLVNFFKSWFGWLPGGMIIMVVLVCSFFTTFTGASGVTILALGGLLSFVLIESGYSSKFTRGLLTSSGSIGLLFPPSLPIILYGVVSQTSIKKMFAGGILPGLLMVAILSVFGIIASLKNKASRVPFGFKAALSSLRESVWDLLLPVIILAGFFGGITTIVETGAVSVVYSLIIALFIHRDIKPKNLPGILLKSIPIIGGVLMILGVSRGLSYYIIDAEIPTLLSDWVRANIESKYVFLILLNLALLITGCLMDIFSAIMVVVPLILPLGAIFGIDPVHLGIIFLANLELGYLTPPVGLNLFLASYRFETPLATIYRYVVPFFLVLLLTVVLITYVPWMSTFLPGFIE